MYKKSFTRPVDFFSLEGSTIGNEKKDWKGLKRENPPKSLTPGDNLVYSWL
jgi:hypothetical protein